MTRVNEFGQTEMGRDLLAQDYMLKQLTASLMYPEKELGQEFWNRVYEPWSIQRDKKLRTLKSDHMILNTHNHAALLAHSVAPDNGRNKA